MNQEVRKFADAFESRMVRSGRQAHLNENELRFLDQVFGPEFAFNFQGLTAQMPFADYSGATRYVDFYYESAEVKLLIEVDSLKYHVTGITHQQYDDHQVRQNDMVLNGGWVLVRFTANLIAKQPMVCRRQLVQAVGKSLIMARHYSISSEEQLWQRRKREVIRLTAEKQVVTPQMLMQRFHIARNTASKWLRAMAAEGELIPARSKKLVTGYTLPAYATTDSAE